MYSREKQVVIVKAGFKRIIIQSIALSFKPELLNQLGRLIDPNFDIQKISGLPFGMSIQPMDAAQIIVDYFLKREKQKQLIVELLNSVHYGLNGKEIYMDSLPKITKELEKQDYYYNPEKRLLIKKSQNRLENDWGFLEENKEYSFCFGSIDVVHNSVITRHYKQNTVSDVYKLLHNLIQVKVAQRNGRIWLWEGDGGIVAFHGENSVIRATFSMLDLILSMPIFNAIHNKLSDEIKIRIALHPGNAVYKEDISSIKSEALDMVRTLEKDYTPTGSICISNISWRSLNTNLQLLFGEEKSLGPIGIRILDISVGRKPSE